MSMSLSRQKSCTPCVRSKRKCGQEIPSCRRCIVRGIDCEYVGRSLNRLQRSARRNQVEEDAIVEPSAELYAEGTPGNWQLQQTCSAQPMTLLSPTTDDAFFNFPSHPFNLNLPNIPDEELLRSGVIDDIVAQQNLGGIVPLPSDAILQPRVEFAAKRLATIPRTFAEQGHTTFIHRVLFQDKASPALQDALSACALYCMKSEQNQTLVLRNVEHKTRKLIDCTNPLHASTTDLLAATQALLLYQIIRLFDGDIRLRAQAEVDQSVLLVWVGYIRERNSAAMPSLLGLTDLQLVPKNSNANWHQWLVKESIRRTAITAIMLDGTYSFLKVGHDTVPDYRLSFSAQTALWNTQSEVGWRRAYAEKEHLEIIVTRWDEVIAKAKPDDMEELGVLVMAMLWGIEATEDWLGQRYACRYGLEGQVTV
ncbi:hypothetical protein BKA66DRAFT_478959 [Pyrenochaeta sp. MPI-SDFR-AT-0127]|nr:hypothetical protein BKA66DRAFT_478959 [Pyrenochaeta sp. MPI-SDFR-AT-0127]